MFRMHSSRSAKPEKFPKKWILRTPQRRDRFAQKARLVRGREYPGPLIPVVGNVTCWSSDAAALKRASERRDILEDIISTAIMDERKAKARRIPQIGSSDSGIDLELIDLDFITSDELTGED